MPGPDTQSGPTGSARRWIESHGIPVEVVGIYGQEIADSGGENRIPYSRGRHPAVMSRPGDFERELTAAGPQDTETVIFRFAPSDGSPRIDDGQHDVPDEDELPGGDTPDLDHYHPSYVMDTTNRDAFITLNTVVQTSGVTTVTAEYDSDGYDSLIGLPDSPDYQDGEGAGEGGEWWWQ